VAYLPPNRHLIVTTVGSLPPQPNIPVKLLVSRAPDPINEFAANAEILYNGFWPLFPLAAGLGAGPLPPATTRHLLTQFHNVFASSHQLIYFLADQLQRHAVLRGVNRRVRSSRKVNSAT
jgi:hypothetical protein